MKNNTQENIKENIPLLMNYQTNRLKERRYAYIEVNDEEITGKINYSPNRTTKSSRSGPDHEVSFLKEEL